MTGEPPSWMDEIPPSITGAYGGTSVRTVVGRPVVQASSAADASRHIGSLRDPIPPDTQQVAVLDDPASREVMETLRNSLYPGASYQSIAMVISWCRVNNVDPFLKAVHIVAMSVKKPGTRNDFEWRDVLMPGIADYRIKASRSGTYLGKSEPEFGPMVDYELSGVKVSAPEYCKITVRRAVQGQVASFTATEYWIENYATAKRDTQAPNSMWLRRSRGQLAKCTEAQALRMAFPEFNGGAPTAEEMEGKQFFDTFPEVMAAPAALAPPADKLGSLEEALLNPSPKAAARTSVEQGAPRATGYPPSVRAARPGEDNPAPPQADAPFLDRAIAALAIDGGVGHRWVRALELATDKCPTIDDLESLHRLPVVVKNLRDAPPEVRSRIETLFKNAAVRLGDVGQDQPVSNDDDGWPGPKTGEAA